MEVHCNKCQVRLQDDRVLLGIHFEDVLLVPENARNLEKQPLDFVAEDAVYLNSDPKWSPGMMLEDQGEQLRGLTEVQEETAKHLRMNPGKMEKLVTGMSIVYIVEARLLDPRGKPKACSVGKVLNVSRAEASIVVHCHRPISDGHLRVQWKPVFVEKTVSKCWARVRFP